MFAKIVLAVAVIAVSSADARDPIDNSDIFDCSGKADGNYPHPNDCTRFIICSHSRTTDFPCADCNYADNDLECQGQHYLRWNQTGQECDYPKYIECEGDGQVTTTQRPSTTTTRKPSSTTEKEVTSTAQPPSTICNGIQAGDSCTKDDCELCGYCLEKLSYYFRCVRTFPSDPKDPITGVIHLETCDADHWWNPNLKPVNSTVGGACDKWDNLSSDVQEAYKNDPECVPVDSLCEWGQDKADTCTGRHWYLDPKKSDVRQDLQCNTDLIWDPTTETCRDCANVTGCSC